MSEQTILKYIPHFPVINPNFWYKLTQLKLDVDRLEENRKHLWGWFSNLERFSNLGQPELSFMELDCASFNSEYDERSNYFPIHGYVINKNTVELFKESDKLMLIYEEGQKLIQQLKEGLILKDPSLLNTFLILSFADLKKYNYYFWFAFPTPTLNILLNERPKNISDVFNDLQVESLLNEYNNISSITQKNFFVVKIQADNSVNILTLESVLHHEKQSDLKNVYFAFSDPSTSVLHPGWPLRNYLALILYYCPDLQSKNINILSLRLTKIKACDNSLIFNVKFPEVEGGVDEYLLNKSEDGASAWVGWQRNERGKFGPKMVDMSSSMDPIKLAENSVDLNLKLMKWRLLPDIDLEKLKEIRFLLLGAGTLGCAVARNLLAWGVRNISLVDSGKVSYSNPVRQNLFNHEDCLNGGKPKALAAAENLKKIFPSVNSVGHVLSIPMPGHSVGECLLEEARENVLKLTELITNHDVIFLLTDSRESRWLPTVLAVHFDKIVINAALGFETYLVMRHGGNKPSTEVEIESCEQNNIKSIRGNELGCYFCNDITAPGNSLKDRTLDQQCTVTRPGISPLAGALAVELVVSLLQHSEESLAPAYYKTTNDLSDIDMPNECLLGIIPHSIRGFLSTYSQVLPATRRYQKCIACSIIIAEEYKKHGFEFLLKVFNSSKHLEDVTGLTELQQMTDVEAMWEIPSDSDE